VVVAILAGHVIGHGRVISDWANAAAGSSSMDEYRVAVVIFSAALVALAGIAAAAATEVWPEPVDGWRSMLPARPGYVAVGAAVAVLMPPAWSLTQHGRPTMDLGSTALAFALPWGVGIAAVGWLRGRAAVVAGATVAVSAVLCAAFIVSVHMHTFYSTTPGDD